MGSCGLVRDRLTLAKQSSGVHAEGEHGYPFPEQTRALRRSHRRGGDPPRFRASSGDRPTRGFRILDPRAQAGLRPGAREACGQVPQRQAQAKRRSDANAPHSRSVHQTHLAHRLPGWPKAHAERGVRARRTRGSPHVRPDAGRVPCRRQHRHQVVGVRSRV